MGKSTDSLHRFDICLKDCTAGERGMKVAGSYTLHGVVRGAGQQFMYSRRTRFPLRKVSGFKGDVRKRLAPTDSMMQGTNRRRQCLAQSMTKPSVCGTLCSGIFLFFVPNL